MKTMFLKVIRRILIFISIIIVINASFVGIVSAQAVEDFTWAVAGFGGAYYLEAAAVATYINRSDLGQKYRISVQVAGGALENVRRLQAGEIDFGGTDDHIFYWHQVPEAEWDEVYDNVRMICTTHGGGFPFVTTKNSGIETFKDLAGKRVSMGSPGSGNSVVAMMAMKALGIYDEIIISHHQWNEAPDALSDGHVDAFLTSTLPTAYIEELSIRRDITWVGLSEEEEAILSEKAPHINIATIKSGVHGVEKSVRALGINSWWTTHKDVPEEPVYEIMKAFFTEEGLKAGAQVTDYWKNWTFEHAIDYPPAPLHPAAEKFWKEKGIIP